MSGGRLKRVSDFIPNDDVFCFTYCDGVADVDITASIAFHQSQGYWEPVTVVRPHGRYGAIERNSEQVTAFVEKPRGDGGLINGGFFVLSPKVLDLISADDTTWEAYPLTQLAKIGQMMAFEHHGFWHAMDTLR